jgi:hypothetical protein
MNLYEIGCRIVKINSCHGYHPYFFILFRSAQESRIFFNKRVEKKIDNVILNNFFYILLFYKTYLNLISFLSYFIGFYGDFTN